MTAEARGAARLVEARLGRAPQDVLEAAVVLEAWAGVPAQRALETARALMPAVPAAPVASGSRPPTARRPRGLLVEGAAMLVTVAAIALWAEPLADALGAGVVGPALTWALPLTLGLQWALRARHLGRPSGLAGLRRRRGALVAAAVALLAAGTVTLGTAGALAAALTVTWTSGSILLRRGWVAGYAAIVGCAAPAMLAGAPAQATVAAAGALTAGGAWLALAEPRPRPQGSLARRDGEPRRADSPRAERAGAPGRWGRTLGAGLTGVGVGLLLIGDASVSWAGGALVALALLPSAAGGLWAGYALWRLTDVFPRSLSGVAACDGTRPSVRRPVGVLAGAIARLALVTAAGSAVVLALSPTVGGGLLAGFGLVALAGLLVALLESLGRPGWAAVGIAAGLGAELTAPTPFAGAALVAGGAAAVAVMVPAAFVLLVRPARTLATALWIT